MFSLVTLVDFVVGDRHLVAIAVDVERQIGNVPPFTENLGVHLELGWREEGRVGDAALQLLQGHHLPGFVDEALRCIPHGLDRLAVQITLKLPLLLKSGIAHQQLVHALPADGDAELTGGLIEQLARNELLENRPLQAYRIDLTGIEILSHLRGHAAPCALGGRRQLALRNAVAVDFGDFRLAAHEQIERTKTEHGHRQDDQPDEHLEGQALGLITHPLQHGRSSKRNWAGATSTPGAGVSSRKKAPMTRLFPEPKLRGSISSVRLSRPFPA